MYSVCYLWGHKLRFSPLKVTRLFGFSFPKSVFNIFLYRLKQLPNTYILLSTRKKIINVVYSLIFFLHRKLAYSKLNHGVIYNNKKSKRQIHPRASDWFRTLDYIYTVGHYILLCGRLFINLGKVFFPFYF